MMSEKQGPVDYDVLIVGAGISGINFAYRLQERHPELSYTILEGRHEIGGTWSLFRYPGIRSDSDLYTFGFPWRPWEENSSIAKGELVRKYVQESAAATGIDKHIQFHRMVDRASWSDQSKTWTLDVTANESEKKQVRGRFVVTATGYYDYDQPLQTTIPGIENFQGTVVHPQFWPKDLDYSNKDVVVIGSGATAVTLVPSMADKVSQITMLQRSPGYLASVSTEDAADRFFRRWCSGYWAFQFIRAKYMLVMFLLSRFCYLFPSAGKKMFHAATVPLLPPGMSMEHFTPRYNPFEQRVCACPDADFYKALRKGNADVVTGVIDTVTEKSIRLTSGKELHPDIIVTATGLKLRVAGGMNILVNGQEIQINQKYVWKGALLEDVPNMAFVFGYTDASWTLGADATAHLICRMIAQMRKEGAVAIVPFRSKKEKAEMKDTRLLGLTSTYIEKGKDSIPKTGDMGPWKARSYYFKDMAIAWFGDLKTGLRWIPAV